MSVKPVGTTGFQPSKSKSQFQKEYDDLASLYAVARSSRAENAIIPLVLQSLPTARSRALDIGCGTGQLVSHLARHFDSVAGVDYSIGMLQEARRLTAQTRNVNLAKMDAERLAFGPAAFDFVLAASLLHHVRPRLALSEAVRVLRPGGRLLVVESLRAGPRGAAQPSWRRRGMRVVRAVAQWTRLAKRLGATDALRWMRRWGRHTAGERLLTPEEWTDLAGSVPGCDVGVLHTYVYLLWDRPPTDMPLVSAATSLPS